jgi:hypothetical protein
MDNRAFTSTSTPASTGYSGQDSLVAVTEISDSADTMTVKASVHGTGTEPGGDLERRVESLEARVAALEDAVAHGGEALSAIRHGDGSRARSRRAGAARSGAGDGSGRGDGAAEAFNAGLAAAAKAARDLMSGVQHQWSPRRRT